MWFTKEERVGLLLLGFSMLVGSFLLNKREEAGLAKLEDSIVEIQEEVISAPQPVSSKSKKKLDVNTASFEDLVKVPGIGPKTASLIIERRKSKKFDSVYELKEIKGIGDKKLQKLREYLEVK